MFGGWRCDAVVLSLTDPRVVAMDLGDQVEGCARACTMALGLQAHAQDEGQEADHRVGADAIRQAMMHRRDLDIGFQNAKVTLEVRETLLACNRVSRAEIAWSSKIFSSPCPVR